MSPRSLILQTMHRLGMMRLWQYANRGKIPILTFHGVDCGTDKDHCPPLRPRLAMADFRRYLDVLSQCFGFITLETAVDMLSGRRPLRPYSLVLTFDDGYLNNATCVWPVLMQYNAPATFFVSTDLVGTGEAFWADRLDYAISHLRREVDHLVADGSVHRIAGRDRRALTSLFWRIKNTFTDMGWERAQAAVEAIEREATSKIADAPSSDRWAGFMNWEQVRQMQRQGAQFGSHTASHRPLDELSPEEVMAELVSSKEELERQTNRPCSCLAYPRGRCSDDVAAMAQQAGYRCAVTTVEAPADTTDPLMLLPRVGLPSRTLRGPDLRARAIGLSATFLRLRRHWPIPARRPLA